MATLKIPTRFPAEVFGLVIELAKRNSTLRLADHRVGAITLEAERIVISREVFDAHKVCAWHSLPKMCSDVVTHNQDVLILESTEVE